MRFINLIDSHELATWGELRELAKPTGVCHYYDGPKGRWTRKWFCDCDFASCGNSPVCGREEPWADRRTGELRADGLCMVCAVNFGRLPIERAEDCCPICCEERSHHVKLRCCANSICGECLFELFHKDRAQGKPPAHVCGSGRSCGKCAWHRNNEYLWELRGEEQMRCPFCRGSLVPEWFQITNQVKESLRRLRAALSNARASFFAVVV